MQRGGVVFLPTSTNEAGNILESEHDAFLFFIRHSVIEYVSKGATGMVFTCTFTGAKPLTSPFVFFHGFNYLDPANIIVIKINFLGNPRDGKFNLFDPPVATASPSGSIFTGDSLKRGLTAYLRKVDFHNELTQFRNIFTASNQHLEPVCPTPIYSEVLNIDNSIPFLNSLRPKNPVTAALLEKIKIHITSTGCELGLIGMESASIINGFEQMDTLYARASNSIQAGQLISPQGQIIALALYELLELAKTGFTQGDYHMGNILMSSSQGQYFDPTDEDSIRSKMTWCRNRRCFMIDFGRALEFSESRKRLFNQAFTDFMASHKTYRSSTLLECTKIIRDAGIYHDGVRKSQFPGQQYSWIVSPGIITSQIATNVRNLFCCRETQIIKLNSYFESIIDRSLATLGKTTEETIDQYPTWSLDFITCTMQLEKDAASKATTVFKVAAATVVADSPDKDSKKGVDKDVKAIAAALESVKLESVGLESVGLESVGRKSVGVEPVGRKSVGVEPVGRKSVERKSVGQKSNGLESVGLESVGLESVGLESVGLEAVAVAESLKPPASLIHNETRKQKSKSKSTTVTASRSNTRKMEEERKKLVDIGKDFQRMRGILLEAASVEEEEEEYEDRSALNGVLLDAVCVRIDSGSETSGEKLIEELGKVGGGGGMAIEGLINVKYEDDSLIVGKKEWSSMSGGTSLNNVIREQSIGNKKLYNDLLNFNNDLSIFIKFVTKLDSDQIVLLSTQSLYSSLFIVVLKYIMNSHDKKENSKSGSKINTDLQILLTFFLNMSNGYNSIRKSLNQLEYSEKEEFKSYKQDTNSTGKGKNKRKSKRKSKGKNKQKSKRK
jgi:hypothetical protein